MILRVGARRVAPPSRQGGGVAKRHFRLSPPRRAEVSFSEALSSIDHKPPPPPPPPSRQPPPPFSSSSGSDFLRRPGGRSAGGAAPGLALGNSLRSAMPHRLDAMKYTHKPAGTL